MTTTQQLEPWKTTRLGSSFQPSTAEDLPVGVGCAMRVQFGYGLVYVLHVPGKHFIYLKNARLKWVPTELMRFFGSNHRRAFCRFLDFLAQSPQVEELRSAAEPDRPLQFEVVDNSARVELWVAPPNTWQRLRRRLRDVHIAPLGGAR